MAPIGGVVVGRSHPARDARRRRLRVARRRRAEGQGRARPRSGAPTPCSPIGARPRRGRPSAVRRPSPRAAPAPRAPRAHRTASACPHLVTVVGEPGIGKTRLLADLGEHVRAREKAAGWFRGRCLPYGESITFASLEEAVRAIVGVSPGDGRDAVGAEARRGRRRPSTPATPTASGYATGSRRSWASPVRTTPPAHHVRSSSRRGPGSSKPTAEPSPRDPRDRGPPLGRRRHARVPGPPGLGRAATCPCSCSSRPARSCSRRIPRGVAGRRTPPRSRSRRWTRPRCASCSGRCSCDRCSPPTRRAPLMSRAGGNPLYALEFVHMLEDQEHRTRPTSPRTAPPRSACPSRCRR